MATGAVIGALRVVLGADTAALEKGLKSAGGAVESFGRQLSVVAAGVGLERLVEKGVSAFIGGIKHAIQAADDLGKAAEKIGIPVEELSRLQFAANIADVSLETLTATLIKFDKNMTEAAAGGAEGFKNALAGMGISLRDNEGQLKTQGDLLLDIADKFQSYEDSAAKTNLSLLLFNKRGAELLPFLNQGAAGIKKLGEESDVLGNTINSKTAAAADKFNQNLKRLGVVVDGIFRAIAQDLAPALEVVSTQLVSVSQDKGFEGRFTAIGKVVTFLVKEFTIFGVAIGRLGSEWNALLKVWDTFPFTEARRKAVEEFNAEGEKTERTLRAVAASFNASGEMANQFGINYGAAAAAVAKSNAPIVKSTQDAKTALDSWFESQKKSADLLRLQIVNQGLEAGAMERLKTVQEGLSAAQEKGATATAAQRAQIERTAATAGTLTTMLEGARLKWENTDPLVRYQTELKNVETQMLSVGATAEEIGRAQQQVADKFGQSWSAVGTHIGSLAGNLSRLTATMGKENKSMLALSKALGIAEVIINTQIAITKAYAALGPVVGTVAAAALVAGGAAAIATIATQNLAQGGSFKVPGGISANDNTMVPLNLASGEQVDVTPADGGGGTTTINVDMRGGDPYFSRGNVERLINAIHTVTADGHAPRLVVLK